MRLKSLDSEAPFTASCASTKKSADTLMRDMTGGHETETKYGIEVILYRERPIASRKDVRSEVDLKRASE